MVSEVKFQNELLIPLKNGAALVASRSEVGCWHATKIVDGKRVCDCRGYQHRGACRHVRAVDAYFAPKPAPVTTIDPASIFLPERPASPRQPVPTFEQFFSIVA